MVLVYLPVTTRQNDEHVCSLCTLMYLMKPVSVVFVIFGGKAPCDESVFTIVADISLKCMHLNEVRYPATESFGLNRPQM